MSPEDQPERRPIPSVAAEDIPVPDGSAVAPVMRLGSLLDELAADADMRHQARVSGRPFGPITPFEALTREYGGALLPGAHIVMGSSGVGKTAYALQIAAQCGFPALYVSCEMGRVELLRRLAARVTGTYLGRLKDGSMTAAAVRELANRAASESPDLAIMDATQHHATRAHIENTARRLKESTGADHVLVVVDSIHSWAETFAPEAGAVDDRILIERACRSVRQIGQALNCPVIAIAEMSRAAQKQDAGENRVTGGAGSRKIEYGAETVLYLSSAKDEEDAMHERGITARFEKNRHGGKGRKVELKFHGALQRYREAE